MEMRSGTEGKEPDSTSRRPACRADEAVRQAYLAMIFLSVGTQGERFRLRARRNDGRQDARPGRGVDRPLGSN